MAEKKQLVLVVDTTSAMEPYWSNIVSNYLDKIIRSFCGDENPMTDHSPIVELAFVLFNVRGSYTASLVERSSWINNMDVFLEWLSVLKFSNGVYSNAAAVAEGLAELLLMFPWVNNGIQDPQRHCILVTASNPYESDDFYFSDAETVAKHLKDNSLVSLSVISPLNLKKLKAIYNAARKNPSETDPRIHIVQHPNHLVLISKSFMEARVALSQSQITNLPSNKRAIIDLTEDSEPTPHSVGESSIIPPATEHRAVSSMAYAHTASSSSRNYTMQNVVPAYTKQPMRLISNNLPQSRLVLGPGDPNMFTRGMMSSILGTSTANVATNMGPTQGTSSALQSGRSPYVLVWKGNLIGKYDGKGPDVTITSLECWQMKTSELLGKDWPLEMRIEGLIDQDYVEKNLEVKSRKVDHLFIQTKDDQHRLFLHMQEKKRCAAIKLPSQWLFLYVMDKASHLFGWLSHNR